MRPSPRFAADPTGNRGTRDRPGRLICHSPRGHAKGRDDRWHARSRATDNVEEAMLTWKIGDVTITRLVEQEFPVVYSEK
jgi:hypothetical protein